MRSADEQLAQYDMHRALITIYPVGFSAFEVRADRFVDQLAQGNEVFEVLWFGYGIHGQASHLEIASKDSAAEFIEVLSGRDKGMAKAGNGAGLCLT